MAQAARGGARRRGPAHHGRSCGVLPGVGRKTANVVLGNAYGINEGITVDTHVARLTACSGSPGRTIRSRSSGT